MTNKQRGRNHGHIMPNQLCALFVILFCCSRPTADVEQLTNKDTRLMSVNHL